jgi:hypothetical protein
VWETHSQTIRSDNWRDFRKKCLFQCGGPAGIRTQISGFTDRCSTVELQNRVVVDCVRTGFERLTLLP